MEQSLSVSATKKNLPSKRGVFQFVKQANESFIYVFSLTTFHGFGEHVISKISEEKCNIILLLTSALIACTCSVVVRFGSSRNAHLDPSAAALCD